MQSPFQTRSPFQNSGEEFFSVLPEFVAVEHESLSSGGFRVRLTGDEVSLVEWRLSGSTTQVIMGYFDSDEGEGGETGGGGTVPTLPAGAQTAASPATLPLHLGFPSGDEITVTVETYGPGAPANVTYIYDATGELMVLNTVAGAGVRITSAAPAVVVEADRDLINKVGKGSGPREPGDMHGAVLNYGMGARPAAGPPAQGYDSGKPIDGDTGDRRPYDAALNVCPTKAGRPALSFLQGGGGGSFSKVRSIPAASMGDAWRPMLRSMGVLTVCDNTLASGRGLPIRPSSATTNKQPVFYADDLNLGIFPALATVADTPTAADILGRLQFSHETVITNMPGGERYHTTLAGESYGSARAELYANAALLCCLNINAADKKRIVIALTKIGLDYAATALNGGRWNTNTGLGGIMAGRKLPVVFAALTTGDAALLELAARNDWAAEDRQALYVSDSYVDLYDYVEDDRGMPEWIQQNTNNTARATISRRAGGYSPQGKTQKSYRRIFLRHLAGASMAMRLITGGRALWNNEAYFDLSDRMMHRTFYRNGDQPMTYDQFNVGTPVGNATNWGLSDFGVNDPNPFHRAALAAYRTRPECGPIWNWS